MIETFVRYSLLTKYFPERVMEVPLTSDDLFENFKKNEEK